MTLQKDSKVFKQSLRFFRATLGYFIAGFCVPSLWAYIASPFGLLAGFVGAICIITPIWYLVHYKSLVILKNGDIGVDMGLGVALAVFTRDTGNNGLVGAFHSLPTIVCIIIGASLAGFAAYKCDQYIEKRRGR